MKLAEQKPASDTGRQIKKWQAIERFLIHLLIFLVLLRWVVGFFNRCL